MEEQFLPWKLLIFDLAILCSRLTLNFWTPGLSSHVCTAKNTHLDWVRTSLYPLQTAHTAGQPITDLRPFGDSAEWLVSRVELPPSFLHRVWFCSPVYLTSMWLLPVFALFPTIQIYFRRKCGAEYASGVSGACYSRSQSYRRCIYSMCCVLSTCVGMHMLCPPRDYAGALKNVWPQCITGAKINKNKSSGGRSLGGVRSDMSRWCGARWSFLLL